MDADAATYITAVEAADGQSLQSYIANAIDAFVVGLKEDGVWASLSACCLLAGPRSLAGSHVALVGVSPTSINFASGDHSQTLGNIGNGSTKYLNTNRASTADAQNDVHQSVWISAAHPSGTLGGFLGNAVGSTGSTHIFSNRSSGQNSIVTRSRSSATAFIHTGGDATGFIGHSRSSSANFVSRVSGNSTTTTATSETIAAGNSFVFARNNGGSPANYSGARIAWYSIGSSVDLALLDSRLTTYLSSILTPPTTQRRRSAQRSIRSTF